MIGIFDSGIGGLTVVRAILDQLPGYDLIYLGDTARAPYGSKSSKTIIDYAFQNTEFLLNRGAKIIVIACNTASSIAYERISESFNLPLFEVITPTIDLLFNKNDRRRIGVIGTRATVKSGIYQRKIKEINPEAKVYSKACPLLVPLVEEGWLEEHETPMIVKKYLYPLKVRKIDTLILGCTHYPLLTNTIREEIGEGVEIVDSSLAVACKIKSYLKRYPQTDEILSKNSECQIFVSDITKQIRITANIALKKTIYLKSIKV
jgi:glutamate racemase